MRDAAHSVPAIIRSEKDGDFTFKLCQEDWKLVKGDEDYMQPPSSTSEHCNQASQAFYADKTKGTCTTNFSSPEVRGLH